MPCNSDYLNPTGLEKQLSRVACLLDELNGIKYDREDWAGYHKKIYSRQVNGDALVSELCSKLQKVDVSKYSLEMQLWWRDHQKADKERVEKEIKAANLKADKEAALKKLTPYERKLLGY